MQEHGTRDDLRAALHDAPVAHDGVHESGTDQTPDTAPFTSSGETASMLAYEEDANVRELKAKVSKLVSSKFGGDYHRAFNHYAGGGGKVGNGALKKLLEDAGVGNGLTRGAWVTGIIDKLDKDGDGSISWSEFQGVTGSAVAAA